MIGVFHRAALAAALLAGCIAAASAQTAPSAVTIVAPPEGSYVTGPITLQAHVIDAPQVRQLTFFADGRSICTLVRAPFECSWDAGIGIREHVIRVVATMNDGARVVVTTRDEERRLHRVGGRGRRPGDGHRHRQPEQVRARPAARDLPREGRQRRAATDRVRRREHPARAGRGCRRQRKHDQRDAHAEGRGEDVPERASANGPGHAHRPSTTTSSRSRAARRTRSRG